MIISKIEIEQLHGNMDCVFNIKDNKLIIVAENGGGKTTILKMVYYFLTKRWNLLSKFQFNKMIVAINGMDLIYEKQDTNIKTDFKIIKKVTSEYPIKNDLLEIFNNYDFDILKNETFIIERLEMERSWRKGQLNEVVQKICQHSEGSINVPEFDDIPIMYLPTYRRTENEFMNIFSNLNEFSRGYLIDNFEEIEENLLNLEHEKDNIELRQKEDILKNFFTNLWSDFLKIRNQKNISDINFAEFGMQDVEKLIDRYLYQFSKTEDKELYSTKINNFTSVVNKYFEDSKKIIYQGDINKLSIRLNNDTEISMSELSSGEKQIVALFTYLHLSDKRHFVIFDEPELSISIFWQKRLLHDIVNSNSTGLISATHSPFIYKNELFEYVQSLKNTQNGL